MVYQWEADTQYNLGDVVVFEGHKYGIVQPHRSQSDWTPPVTPALWRRLPEEARDSKPPSHDPQPEHDQQKPWDQQHTQKVDIPHEEQKKNWWDIDDKRKKELEIGGGLALGAALLGGGLFAYKHHQKNEEEKKAHAWGLQAWLKEAQDRTERFHQHGPSGPTEWVLVHGKEIPQGAIHGGEENGQPLFVCRAFHDGSVQVGKAGRSLSEGGAIGYSHDEIPVNVYEVLVGDQRAIRWVDTRGRLDLDKLGAKPIDAGYESNDVPLFVAQAHINNSVQPGKCSPHLDGAFIPYGGTEKHAAEYRVLCYA